MTHVVECRSVSKSFGETRALINFDLLVGRGELMTLLGPSGCGKSTALRLIAGFDVADTGDILINGTNCRETPANERRIGFVFQNYSLFPHLGVAGNIEFGLRLQGMSRAARRARVAELLGMVRLQGLEDRYPHQLSGGQQQRVAVARALAIEPEVLLLDEPLSALDATVRREVRIEIRRVLQEADVAAIFVTHDQEEALSISDRVCVMNSGRVEQVGAPREVYSHPETRFTAGFVGNTSCLRVTSLGNGRLQLADSDISFFAPHNIAVGESADLLVRPERVTFADTTVGGPLATIEAVSFLGTIDLVTARFDTSSQSITGLYMAGVRTPVVGERVAVQIDASAAMVFAR